MSKKILRIFIVGLILTMLFSNSAFAEDGGISTETVDAEATDSADTNGSVQGIEAVQAGDHILLGSIGETPVDWIILDANMTNAGAPGMFLLSKNVLQDSGVSYSDSSAKWAGSKAQEYCTDFYNTVFSELEKSLIPTVTVTEESSYSYEVGWKASDLSNESVFFISAPELTAFFGEDSSTSEISAKTTDGRSVYYWLRSLTEYDPNYAGIVIDSNRVLTQYISSTSGARPATNMLQDHILYLTQLSTEDDGKPLWKAGVLDENASFKITKAEIEDETLTISYQTDLYGEDCRLAMIIYDSDGKLSAMKKVDSLASQQGTAEVTVPTDDIPPSGHIAFASVSANEASSIDIVSKSDTLRCTVSFSSGDGSGNMDSVSSIPGDTLTLPDCGFGIPANKNFDHWECNGETFLPGQNVTVSGDMNFTAIFTDIPIILELNFSSLSLKVGQGTVLCAVVTPSDGTDISFAWETDNSRVVKLTPQENGYCALRARWPGTTTVRCSAVNGCAVSEMQVTVKGSPIIAFFEQPEGIAAVLLLAAGVACFLLLRKRTELKIALLPLILAVIFILACIGISTLVSHHSKDASIRTELTEINTLQIASQNQTETEEATLQPQADDTDTSEQD